jgi:predicted Zn finger-like uncharacterized protein
MFTLCPKCALTLVVTAADLRVAQGYVRCGRCLNVFNALARLSEERPARAPPPDAAGPTSAAAATEESEDGAAPQPSAPSAADDAGEIEVELDASLLETSAHAPAALQETAEPPAKAEGPLPATPAPPSAAVAASAAVAMAAPAETREKHAQPTSVAPAPATEVPHDPVQASQSDKSSPPAQLPDALQTNTPQQRPEEAFELVTRRPRAGLAWTLGAGALAIALVLQVVNHYRDALAANPALRGPLSAVYSALGVKLAPRWNIKAYEVRQLGASVSGATAGEIVVRASVKNAASRAQPLPLLRVTLQDRFGNRIAARDVPPRDYLPSPVAPGSLLAAGSRVDATMVFVDPGPQAVGFEIDACLPLKGGEVACAHGP